VRAVRRRQAHMQRTAAKPSLYGPLARTAPFPGPAPPATTSRLPPRPALCPNGTARHCPSASCAVPAALSSHRRAPIPIQTHGQPAGPCLPPSRPKK
jgi:hypothetical protein